MVNSVVSNAGRKAGRQAGGQAGIETQSFAKTYQSIFLLNTNCATSIKYKNDFFAR